MQFIAKTRLFAKSIAKSIAQKPAPVRLGLFLLVLLLLWLPVALPVYLLVGNQAGAALGILLYCGFVALIWFWGRYVAQQSQPYAYYGLTFSRSNLQECLAGLAIGLASLASLMLLQTSFGWLSWQSGVDWQGAVIPGMLTGVGVGFAEELLFRGWLLTELEQDYGKSRSLLIDSSFFALTHFIKTEPIMVLISRLPQFPGLMLLGLDLVWARRSRQNRLGLSIGLHGGLVWGYYVVNTTHWLKPSQSVPEWITGIGGNPLAGFMGLLFLSSIAIGLRTFSQPKLR